MQKEIKKILNKKHPSIHFVGIGGKGLNGIAKICIKKGWYVSGSDKNKSEETKSIEKVGGNVKYGHNKLNIDVGIDLVVRTSIIGDDNPEIKKSKELDIPILKRSEFLGYLMKPYKSISVAGSHGKSTTTALIGLALQFSNLDPTIFGGAYIKEIGAYERLGKGEHCVVEACEYDRSFFDLVGDVGILTSIEKSHMEYYKDEDEMVGAFKEFVSKFSEEATIIANGDDLNIRRVVGEAKCNIVTFGFNASSDYVIKNEKYEKDSSVFDIYHKGKCLIGNLKIKIPGEYNVLNFASVVALFDLMNVDMKSIVELGEIFKGVGRRFEIRSLNENLVFVDDFCHHPTQVKNLFKGLKQFFPDRKILAVFQPRQYHLIRTFLKEYGESFKDADNVIVTEIVPALGDSQEDIKSLKVKDVVDSITINSHNKNTKYLKSFPDIIEEISNINEKSVIATIGAGNVNQLREMYISSVKV